MARRSQSLINSIIILFVLSVIVFSGIILAIQINSFNISFQKEASLIQSEYTESQKTIVKREVHWAADYIYNNLESLEERVGEIVKKRTLEAYDIASGLYEKYSGRLSDDQIAGVIREALRPIRYADGQGYFFITSYSGIEILFADRPELEGLNLIDMQAVDGAYVIRDMIQLTRDKGEGLYEYLWTKPGSEDHDHSKISYIKHFEPFDWIIGTGLYLDDEETAMRQELLANISEIRFGTEGYVFVNTMEGDALVSNGELMSGDQKLWEVFSANPEKTRDLFRKEYEAAIKPEGDFIYYSIRKLTDSTKESPKTSFILGIPEFDWLLGAGVYLDDVEADIELLREISYQELRGDIIETVVITLSLIALFIFFFYLIGRRLQKDFDLFSGFFREAVSEDAKIDEDDLRYSELAGLASQANTMQKEKTQALEQLKSSESRFRLLAEYSQDMIFKLAFPEGVYEYISPASLEITGYTPEEIMSEALHVRKVIHPDWADWLEEKLKSIAEGEIDDFFEYQIIHKNGEVRWIFQKNTLIRDEATGKLTLIGRMSDDTRRKKAEEELNRSYRMEAIGKLAGGVAHDFNNVLAGIMNAANVLKSPRRTIDEKGRNMADLILKAAARAADLTAKLTAFSGKRTLMLKPLDMHYIIEETSVILRRTIDKQIGLHMNLQAEHSHIRADGTEIQSMILNLCINASHAIEGQGHIYINTENTELDKEFCQHSPFDCRPGTYIRMEILDTGIGIDEETLEHIFEPFFTTKEKGKGSGLGLSTVYRSVRDHKGLIQVASEIGQGTSLIILLPITEELPEKKEGSVSTVESGTGTILFVDDEEFIREAGRSMIEEMGYTVLVASDGKEAVDIFRQSSGDINLVILDVIMPKMSGTEAFRAIKELKSECPVIMISGHTREDDLSQLRKEGLASFIRKPFDEVELSREIKRHLKSY